MFILAFLLHSFILAPALAGGWPDISTPVKSKTRTSRKDAALIIALDDYAFVPDVPGAQQNGRDWYTWFTRSQQLDPSRVSLLENTKASRETILDEARRLAKDIPKAGRLWFVFIGHGAPSKDGRDALMLGADVQQTARSVYARSVSQTELLRILASSGAPVTAIIDACFSGKNRTGESIVSGLQPLIVVRDRKQVTSTVLTAGKVDEFAGDLPGLGRPAFSYLVLGALRGWGDSNKDGQVTGQEIVAYTRKAILSVVQDRRQTPQGYGQGLTKSLSQAVEEGPDLVSIRLALADAAKHSSTAGNSANQVTIEGGSKSNFAELARTSKQAEAKLDAAEAKVKTKAAQDWSTIRRSLQGDARPLVPVVRKFIAEYRNVALSIEGRSRKVSIPQVAFAQQWLASAKGGQRIGFEGNEVVLIPAGTFTMGCTAEQKNDCELTEKPGHQVTISRPFYMMQNEVTQGLYKKVTGKNPSKFAQKCGSNCPVEKVSWYDAVRFANALSEQEGLETCYELAGKKVSWPKGLHCTGWRLPTEAEWEYAARGGQATKYAGSSEVDAVAWYIGNSGLRTHPVCSKKKNGYGLCDMSGNVFEWVWDKWSIYGAQAQTDPVITNTGTSWGRSWRGGAWRSPKGYTRVSNRLGIHLSSDIGIRLVRSKVK